MSAPAAGPIDPGEKGVPPAPAPDANIQVLALPLAFTVLLAAFGAVPAVRANPRLLWSFWGVAAGLLLWNGALALAAASSGRALTARLVIRRPHWLQPIVQGTIYVYWGWHWQQVRDSAYLIAAQLVFAYAFDMLLAWSRDDEYELGFGPFPIILSINLFLWFKPDWFYWQFALVALGFAVKRLVRWKKDGYLAHIFNPSSFPLAIISAALLLTGTTDHTWGVEIANTLAQPAHMYLLLFVVSIPGQILFGVASMSMPAVVTTYLLSAIYFLFTGTYYFVSTIPTAAFRGMLLLFTDPSTAPKSELGRIIYGVLYGLSIFVLYGLLDLLGLPLFYDKLLFVPFLNLAVRALDRLAQSPRLSRINTASLAPWLTGRKRNAALAVVWGAAFAVLLALHGVGDDNAGNHLPFWLTACAEGRRNGCRNMETVESDLCEHGGAWACNELGIRLLQPGRTEPAQRALDSFQRACQLRFRPGCSNLQLAHLGPAVLVHAPPDLEDYQHLIDNRGLPNSRTGLQELQWACEQGWTDACSTLELLARSRDSSGAAGPSRLEQECVSGNPRSCQVLGQMYRAGDGVQRDDQRALACSLGLAAKCVRESATR